jgi:trigger factor
MISIQTRESYVGLRERLQEDGGLDRMKEQMRREKAGTVLYERLAG